MSERRQVIRLQSTLASGLANRSEADIIREDELREVTAVLNSSLGRAVYPSNSWVEVVRYDDRLVKVHAGKTFEGTTTDYGCWFYLAAGSGMWVNVGRTYAAPFKLSHFGRGLEPLVRAYGAFNERMNRTAAKPLTTHTSSASLLGGNRSAGEPCGLSLLRQLSSTVQCVLGATFGCSGKAVMFVERGCRGVFQCGSLMTKCGYRGQEKDARYECTCGQQLPCWLDQGQPTRRYVACNETAIHSEQATGSTPRRWPRVEASETARREAGPFKLPTHLPHGDYWPPIARDVGYDSVQVQHSFNTLTGGYAELTLLSQGCMTACTCKIFEFERTACAPANCRPAVEGGCAPGVEVRTGWVPQSGRECAGCSTREITLNCATVAKPRRDREAHGRAGERASVGRGKPTLRERSPLRLP